MTESDSTVDSSDDLSSDEMAALAMNGLFVLKGEITPKEYK